jgi:hypothetical protein
MEQWAVERWSSGAVERRQWAVEQWAVGEAVERWAVER